MRLADREAGPDASWRDLRGRAEGQWRDVLRRRPAILAAFGVEARQIAGRRGAEDHPAARGAGVRGEKPRIARVSVYADDQLKATVALNDNGAYEPVSIKAAQGPRKPTAADEDNSGGMSLYQSLYETALKQGLPKPMIDLLTRVFANDVDFQRSTAPGDSIEAFFSDPDDIDPRAGVALRLRSPSGIRRTNITGSRRPTTTASTIYDENGRSSRKFLLRKPIAEGDITSPFGMRFHPDPALYAHAHRRRLGGADRHADLTPPATASSSRRGGMPATGGGSRSSTPTAT